MISQEDYDQAIKNKEAAQGVIDAYHIQKRELFAKRLQENPIFSDDELIYSEFQLCPCGHGLAYPKDCSPGHYWDCSAILKGTADKGVEHCGQLPFAYYSVRGESGERTTRGVFKPKA